MGKVKDLVDIGWKNRDRALWDTEAREWFQAIGAVAVDAEENPKVTAAYMGMRYRNDDPPAGTIGTTPEKVTLFDESLPLLGESLNGEFDQATDETVVDEGQGGVYEATTYVNFEGEQGEVYTIDIYIDQNDGNGPQPSGAPIYARVSQADPYAELERSVTIRINGGWRFSVWANADKVNTDLRVFIVSFSLVRVSAMLEDQ